MQYLALPLAWLAVICGHKERAITLNLTFPELHTVDDAEAVQLCGQIRRTLIEDVSQTGGHLASNLGLVELTVALHRVFDFEKDRLVFDVGHQCYTHKILSGRGPAMDTLRTFGGLSGFPKPGESVQDAFIAGHASNSVSVALGMARGRTLLKEDYHVMAVLGDGALTGGLAYEGLSDAGQSGEPLLIILNDNGMSITKSVGGIANHLARQRLKPQYLRFKHGYRKVMSVLPGGKYIYRFTHSVKTAIKGTLLPCSMFEDMGFTYMGPVDGHNVADLTQLLRDVKENINGPVLLHVRTVKGKGYSPAEQSPDAFHGVSKFAVESGMPLKAGGESFSSVFGKTLCGLAAEDSKICAITAAMQPGTGLDGFAKSYPNRFYDVGIAEGHAVTMAAGMAKQGAKPVFAVYSTFLQRSYDMLVHDVAIQNLPVVLAVDRAGLVGEDGETHHGLYDVGFLSTVPGMEIWAPGSFAELRAILRQVMKNLHGPVAIRYPRGGEAGYSAERAEAPTVMLRDGNDFTLITYGTMTGIVLEAVEKLKAREIDVRMIKLNRITPVDTQLIDQAAGETGGILVVEEAAAAGSAGERLAGHFMKSGILPKVYITCNAGDRFVPQGTVAQQRKLCGIDADSIFEKVWEVMGHG